jgi:hypothetical protein
MSLVAVMVDEDGREMGPAAAVALVARRTLAAYDAGADNDPNLESEMAGELELTCAQGFPAWRGLGITYREPD